MHPLPGPGWWPPGQEGGPGQNGRSGGLPGVLPVSRVDPAGGAARVVYVVDLAVEVARLLPALRQGQLRPGHLPERGPRSPMQLLGPPAQRLRPAVPGRGGRRGTMMGEGEVAPVDWGP